jgi:hypothetical protein
MRNRLLYPVLIFLFLIHTNFKCVSECSEETEDVPATITEPKVSSLDNRGAEPVVLPPGAIGYLRAYGIRFSINTQTPDQSDTIFCARFFLSPAFNQVRIYTVNGLEGIYAPGADVTDLFQLVEYNSRLSPRYLEAPSWISGINNRWAPGYPASFDFLFTEPPPVATGWRQFELRLLRNDTTVLSLPTDSIFLQ